MTAQHAHPHLLRLAREAAESVRCVVNSLKASVRMLGLEEFLRDQMPRHVNREHAPLAGYVMRA
jgi:hypothetical protein